MFLYNITMQVSWLVHDVWLRWLHNTYIPFVVKSNCFKKQQLVKLLQIDDTEGPTYALQLYAAGKTDYDRYITDHLPEIEKQSFEKWEGEVLTFATLMEVIDIGEN